MKLSPLKEDKRTDKSKNTKKTVMKGIHGRFFVLVLLISGLLSCEDRKDLLSQDVYDGPIMELFDIKTMMTDSLRLVIKIHAPKQQDFEGGDRIYPDGFYLEYFKDDQLVCTFQSDIVKYTSEDNVYKGEGDVIVKNEETGDVLNTEELFWDPTNEKFYTDKFVTIVADEEVHTGQGLTANQDFTSYQIHQPSGTLTVEDES